MPRRPDPSVAGVPSPCIRNCCLDDKDICLGCLRTITEIMSWASASEAEKRDILVQCELRRAQRRR
jgi:predicted Fe-S protein YdhL (DUF1289 family)